MKLDKISSDPKIFFMLPFYYMDSWPLAFLYPLNFGSLFFYAGAFLAKYKCNLFLFDRYGFFITLTYIFILVIDVLTKWWKFNSYIHNIGILFGMISVLFLTRFSISKEWIRKKLLKAADYSFFVFAIHLTILLFCKKLVFKYFNPNTDLEFLFLYLLLPVLIIFISIFIYTCVERFFPKVLEIIIGGRGKYNRFC